MPGFGKINEETIPAVGALANGMAVVGQVTAGVGQTLTTVGLNATFVLGIVQQLRQESAQAQSDFERLSDLMGAGAGGFAQTQLSGLERLAERVRTVEAKPGEDLGISRLIENSLARARSGEITVEQAIAEIIRTLNAEYGLIQREYSTDTDPSIRALWQELERFINSGQLT